MSNVRQLSFSAGELAPALYARTDQVRYASGLRTCRNFIVQRAGGVSNRPGTEYVGPTTPNRLLPFVFNDDQTYVLEFSDRSLRFIRDGGYIGGGTPYSVSTPYLAADLMALQIVQSADVVTITHDGYAPRDLKRFAETNWTLTVISFTPPIAAPTGLAVNDPTTAIAEWVVTAIDEKTNQESFPSAPVGGATTLSAIGFSQNRVLSWTPVPGAVKYNIYKGGGFLAGGQTDHGWIGETTQTTFLDNSLTPDMLNRAPVARTPFDSTDHYPGAVGYFQGRKVYGGTIDGPETVWTSRSGDYANMTVSSPSQDDDAITFTLASRTVSRITHLLDVGAFVILSSGGEWVVGGDGSGVLRPTDINAVQVSEHGCSALVPIKIDRRILFVESRRAIVRDISKDPWYGYKGSDLTIFSSHLFDGHSIVDWAYQELPNSIVWVVRDDGVLLGLTNIDDQQVLAWHRHDTDGAVERVCVVPEGTEDRLYLTVRRTINGVVTRSVERMASRFFTDVADAILTDATLTYDGRNTTATTMTLSGGSTWGYDELLTCTASASSFTAGDVGNRVVLTAADGTVIRFRITGYTSATIVTGFPQKTVPVSLRGVAVTTWARAVDQVTGLGHLEGKAVSVFADGFVVASPNNPSIDPVVVTGGTVSLREPYGYIHVGLPITADLETLDIDRSEGPSVKSTKMLVSEVSMQLVDSRGIFVGAVPPTTNGVDGLVEYKARQSETYDQPISLRTDTVKIQIPGEWTSNGRVFLRQIDPVPLTILSVIPTGYIPAGG